MVLAPMVALGAALRLSRWPRFALGMGTVAFFVVLTGAEPSVMRAGVMAGLALIGILLGRPRSTGSILAGAVLILLVIDPALVWSVEFQLSVAATASMVALASWGDLAGSRRFRESVQRCLAPGTGGPVRLAGSVTPEADPLVQNGLLGQSRGHGSQILGRSLDRGLAVRRWLPVRLVVG